MNFMEGENFSFNEKRTLTTNNFQPIANAYSTQNLQQQMKMQGNTQYAPLKTVQQRQMN